MRLNGRGSPLGQEVTKKYPFIIVNLFDQIVSTVAKERKKKKNTREECRKNEKRKTEE